MIFRNAKTKKIDNLTKYSDKQKEDLKVVALSTYFFSTAYGDVQSFDVTLDYAPLSYLNGTYKNNLSNDESCIRQVNNKTITLADNSMSYLVYSDQYSDLPVYVYIIGGIIILGLIALIVYKIIKSKVVKNEEV